MSSGLETKTGPTCQNCEFFHINADSGGVPLETGLCHRYPKAEEVAVDYWCGEYEPNELTKRMVTGGRQRAKWSRENR